MQAYEKRLHLSTLLERAAEELGLDEQVLIAEYGPDVPVPLDEPTAPVVESVETRHATAEKKQQDTDQK
jgi:chromosome segregation protein